MAIPDKPLSNFELERYARIYFDSYGQITPVEVQRYLKTGPEFQRGKEVIQRNTGIVQAPNRVVCGHLCLYVLKSLSNGETRISTK